MLFILHISHLGAGIVQSVKRLATGWKTAGRSSSLRRVKNIIFATSSRPALGPTQPPNQWVPGISPGGKTAGA
jgi:hypothetical protein